MANYSRRVHCVQCGELFPSSEMVMLDGGKAGAVRTCKPCAAPKLAQIEAQRQKDATQMTQLMERASDDVKAEVRGKKER